MDLNDPRSNGSGAAADHSPRDRSSGSVTADRAFAGDQTMFGPTVTPESTLAEAYDIEPAVVAESRIEADWRYGLARLKGGS